MSQGTPTQVPHLLVKSRGEPVRIELETDSSVLIGSGGHCKIQLVGDGIRSLHCIVAMKEDGNVEVRDWNTGCTFVNGTVISDPVTLNDGDRIKIAGHEIVAALPSSAIKPQVQMAPPKPQQPFPVGPPAGQIQVEFAQPEQVAPPVVHTQNNDPQPAIPVGFAHEEPSPEVEVTPEPPTVEVETVGSYELPAALQEVAELVQESNPTEEQAEDLASSEDVAEPLVAEQVNEVTPVAEPAAVEEPKAIAEVSQEQEPDPVVAGAAAQPETVAAEQSETVAESVEDESTVDPVADLEPVAEVEPALESESVVKPVPSESQPSEADEVVAESKEEPHGDEELPADLFDSVDEDEFTEEELATTERATAETEGMPTPSAEYVYDVDADLEEDVEGYGYDKSAFAKELIEDDEYQSLRMENEQLRFELSQRSVESEDTGGFLDRDQTAQMVARLEDLLNELKRSDDRTRELEELLRSADQATRDEREERMQLESLITELEQRVEERESKSDTEVEDLKQKLEEARKTQRQSNDSLQVVIEAKTTDVQTVPLEIVIELKNQVELLLEQLKASHAEVAMLKEQIEERDPAPSSSEMGNLDAAKEKLTELQLELSRERAEISRERAEMQRLKVELETRLERKQADVADTRIRAMREHLKEIHEKEVAERGDDSGENSGGLAGRITSLLQRVKNE